MRSVDCACVCINRYKNLPAGTEPANPLKPALRMSARRKKGVFLFHFLSAEEFPHSSYIPIPIDFSALSSAWLAALRWSVETIIPI